MHQQKETLANYVSVVRAEWVYGSDNGRDEKGSKSESLFRITTPLNVNSKISALTRRVLQERLVYCAGS